jgi:1,4-dihydroxy-6-naphthoate synthase
MNKKIKIGISTCPNDTFAFHALLHNKIETAGLQFEFELHDVQQLNEMLLAGNFDVCKASFHAALLLSEQMSILDAGAALGFGNGPLLLAARENTTPAESLVDAQGLPRDPLVLCPGKQTTARLLYQLFYPQQGNIQDVIFSEIMPRLKQGTADFGVCIHEGRFTFAEEGLYCVADLGQRWEAETGAPLPLGGILARRRFSGELLKHINSAIRGSIAYAQANRNETLITMRKYAQEFSDQVLFAHVDLYVNEWTHSLTEGLGDRSSGSSSLQLLYEKAVEVRLIPPAHPRPQIVGL